MNILRSWNTSNTDYYKNTLEIIIWNVNGENNMNNRDMKLILKIYSNDEYNYQEKRYSDLIKKYSEHFNESEISFFSSPGRTELGGNHTDHNHGKVLAAAVNLDTIAAASPNNTDMVNIFSEGYAPLSVDISTLEKKKDEEESTESIVRGIASGFKNRDLQTGGFDAVITSDVPPGSGLSSSASFEMLITYIFSTFFNNRSVSIIDSARISKYAENVYFNKPSGLMDQTACGYGGIISIDFRKEGDEIIEPVNFSFKDHGYVLTVIKTDSDHADLTEEYSSITEEMGKVASFFGNNVLREVDEKEFYLKIPQLRKRAGGRAVLRAIHFFNENKKVDAMKIQLKENNIEGFLKTSEDSGNSSFKYLQNVYSTAVPQDQATSLAISLTENFLLMCKKGGACRIHGGGFAGTVQAYIPTGCFDKYKTYIEAVFGKDSAVPLKIRNTPGGFTGRI